MLCFVGKNCKAEDLKELELSVFCVPAQVNINFTWVPSRLPRRPQESWSWWVEASLPGAWKDREKAEAFSMFSLAGCWLATLEL